MKPNNFYVLRVDTDEVYSSHYLMQDAVSTAKEASEDYQENFVICKPVCYTEIETKTTVTVKEI